MSTRSWKILIEFPITTLLVTQVKLCVQITALKNSIMTERRKKLNKISQIPSQAFSIHDSLTMKKYWFENFIFDWTIGQRHYELPCLR